MTELVAVSNNEILEGVARIDVVENLPINVGLRGIS
jgi:hypothetical protein